MKKSVLFVCHGNICRSPMAEYLFKFLTRDKYIVESRATSREEIGNDMHPKTKKVLAEHNIPFKRHYARQITKEDYENFDIIVCFDDYNIHNLERLIHDKSKVMKILDRDVDDPWYTGDFDKTYQDIYKGCEKLIMLIDGRIE